ncbi:MAG: V-type ATP synthase subunit B [Deltaproteobacteria bacterium]|nr:V-type ATP synthase subunit B [Deltaproteobacteria bacterium]
MSNQPKTENRKPKTDISLSGREYLGLKSIAGPLLVVEGVRGVGYDESVEVAAPDGSVQLGRVLAVGLDEAVVELFGNTVGLSLSGTRVRFTGRPLTIPVTTDLLGRVLDGLGRPLDGGPPPVGEDQRDVNGQPINPTARTYPQEFIQTGISAIDGMNTLVRGQKLPLFAMSGLPHHELAAQIVRQARLLTAEERFAVVFAAMGVQHDVANLFRQSFEASGVLNNVVMFLNLADDPAVERLVTPRLALTAAEFLAFDKGHHVLAVLTDMTNYCEALREVATSKGEVPSRKGYPGYLYSDLAAIYERAGKIEGSQGSITQLPILTMPNDDITHPIPDLTGYITEGQIVLDRGLHQRGVYPPINVLPSLSRLMSDGIGEGRTRADHAHVSSQLYASYAHAQRLRALAAIIGEDSLSRADRQVLKFARVFEEQFVRQDQEENRDIFHTLDLAWQVLKELPESDLTRVTEEEFETYGKF